MDSICLLPILTFVTFPGPPWRLVSGRLAGSKAVTELLVLSSSALSHLPNVSGQHVPCIPQYLLHVFEGSLGLVP